MHSSMHAHYRSSAHHLGHAYAKNAQSIRNHTPLPHQPFISRHNVRTKPLYAAAEAEPSTYSSSSLMDILNNSSTAPTRRLSSSEAIDALYSSQHIVQRERFCSFYSSELGGIVTDPALMVVQIDDHMVHRGHAVFDTAILQDGHIYQLIPHVQRFLSSAAKANIPLPPRTSPEQLLRIILETAAASKQLNGHIRYFLSAGRGGFDLSGNTCLHSALYVIVYKRDHEAEEESEDHLKGWKVKTSPVPMKAPFFANIKSNNYLVNVLNIMDAEADGYDQGIFIDDQGHVAEGPNMNVGIITTDGTLIVPPFDACLAGITVQRMLEMIPDLLERKSFDGIERIERRHFTVDEAKEAREVFVVGGSLPVMPVVQWDDRFIGDGAVGLSVLQLRAMMQLDMRPAMDNDVEDDQHVEVPYGYLTGMDI